uniref:LAGLIDADG endonuclease n=1 Tax=Juglanconis oblonga TaxID=1940568 RepID=A0A291LIN4_9PEZI|nr:LAGLIDADG endonuclease [Juglanconis oblonga]ATI20395.1 LAGLIDADG endonuclease [Juglanconis oblonga]
MYVRPNFTKRVKHSFSWDTLGIKKYSASGVGPKPSNLSPWFITGFTDAEGCFSITVYKDSTRPLGWRVCAEFLIGLHKRDVDLLREIQAHLGGIGRIGKFAKDAYALRVNTIGQMLNIIDHFDKYPLISQKHADYLLWREIIIMMQRKEHITEEGLLTILSLRASLNLGLSEALKTAFPNIIPVLRPKVENIAIPHGEWLAGFTSGEGCFFVFVSKSLTHLSGFQVQLVFQITQHSRDERLIQSLISYLGCGKLVTSSDGKVQYRVEKFKDNYEKILPFFNNHKIRGVKLDDFKDWCIVAKLMRSGEHLTPEGVNEIVKIKAGMNKGRA